MVSNKCTFAQFKDACKSRKAKKVDIVPEYKNYDSKAAYKDCMSTENKVRLTPNAE